MKKETFVKFVNAILKAHERQEQLSEKLKNVFMEARPFMERPDFSDVVYDYGLEDDIIDAIELEFGPDGRDKVAAYIYEQVGMGMKTVYPDYNDAGELYDDIMKCKTK